MTPRRLLSYLVLFLVLLGVYAGLTWYQGREETRKAAAKKIFQVDEKDITGLTLKRPKEEIRLVKKDGEWFLEAPLQARADKAVVDSLLVTLASLQKERELESSENLKAFGLEPPILVVEFTAKGKSGRLALGGNTPGELGVYAYKDQDTRHLLVINPAHKSSLDRPLAAFRDKTLFAFAPDKATSLNLKTGQTAAQLEKEAPGKWRWVGRESFPVRGDRVEELLRFLQAAKIKEFVGDKARNLASYGLAPPRGEVTVVQDQTPERLWLGNKLKEDEYARKAPDGPVVLINKDLWGHIAKTLATLEDRRVWRGQISEVQKMAWGPPGKTWVGIKEKDFLKIFSPEKQELKQPAVLLEVSLWKFQLLEFARLATPKSPEAKPLFVLELMDAAGKPLVRLEELGAEKDKEVWVRVKAGDKTVTGLIPRKAYQEWQKEMGRLASPPPEKRETPGQKGGSET